MPLGRLFCDMIARFETVNWIARSKVAPRLSATRSEVVYTPGVVIKPRYPPVIVGGKKVGSGGPSCTRIPGMGVEPGVCEKWYGGCPPEAVRKNWSVPT